MKKLLAACLVLSVLTVMSFSLPAMGWNPQGGQGSYGDHDGGYRGHDGGGGTHDTPDPSTLAMVVTGIAGVGGYLLVRRRNHK